MRRRSLALLGHAFCLSLGALTLGACSSDGPSSSNGGNGGTAGEGSGGAGSKLELVSVPNDQDEFPVPPVDGLLPTPPMGWNSWNSYSARVSAELIEKTADIIVASGMRDAGYVYVNIDDGWALRERTPASPDGSPDDPDSTLEPDPLKFPPGPNGENGIQMVADYVHERGLKLGLYSDRGTATCGGFAASGGYEEMDARAFAAWGVDYLKYDSCNAPMDAASREAQYRAMGDALAAVERPIVYSICSWQFDEWNAEVGQLWRTTGDIAASFKDVTAVTPPSRTILQNVNGNAAYAAYSRPNAWNDADMLEVGNLGNSELSMRQSQTHFNFWAMMASPLIAGNQLDKMSEATQKILTNAEVIAIDQDPLGLQGVPVKSTTTTSVWAKPLNEAGARAVMFFNAGAATEHISISLVELGLSPGSAVVRDLWDENDSGQEIADSIEADVPTDGSMMYVVRGSEPPIPRGTAYLSDLTWTYAANAAGPVERDRSNGSRTAGDGKPLSLRGKTYAKGLGVSAGSKILFRLAKRCSKFHAVAGVDDEVSGAGSVTFQVFADGERLYPAGEPERVTGSDAPQTIDLDLTAKHRLMLLVTGAGDEASSDHGDWADATITCDP